MTSYDETMTPGMIAILNRLRYWERELRGEAYEAYDEFYEPDTNFFFGKNYWGLCFAITGVDASLGDGKDYIDGAKKVTDRVAERLQRDSGITVNSGFNVNKMELDDPDELHSIEFWITIVQNADFGNHPDATQRESDQ